MGGTLPIKCQLKDGCCTMAKSQIQAEIVHVLNVLFMFSIPFSALMCTWLI